MSSDERVLIGMSGGIDSTAACLMLMEQGYQPVGLTMMVWDNGTDSVGEAASLARHLGIEHHVADIRKDFEKTVVANFIEEYLRGRTPNPCVMCNPTFKFRLLAEYADMHDCRYIATGHYSRLVDVGGHRHICRGIDDTKDQSYFLWRLGEDVLQRCIFPLGNYRKSDVREYLRGRGYEAKAQSGESMEVCFIRDDYRDFLREHCRPEDIREGWFVSTDGKKLGKHKGLPYYTVGQRKGLGIALGEPAYVLKLNAEHNTVMLGSKEHLKAGYMLVEGWQSPDAAYLFDGDRRLSVMIRYRGKAIDCQVSRVDERNMIVRFMSEASAVTPGQSAVFYDGDIMLGGGYIANQRMLGRYLNSDYASKLVFR